MLRLTSQAAPALLCVQRERVQQEGPCASSWPTRGPKGLWEAARGVRGPSEVWRDRHLPAWHRCCYFCSQNKQGISWVKKEEASMVTLTHIFFFSSICNLACCVCIRQEVDCLDSHLDPIVALLGRLLLLLLQRLRSLVLEGRRGLLEHRGLVAALEQGGDQAR